MKQTPVPTDDSYELEEDISPWQARVAWLRSWRGIVALAVLVLAITLICSSGSLYRFAKEWRVQHLIAKSEAARDRGDEMAETKTLKQAATLLPTSPLILRAVARYHEGHGDPGALHFYELLLASKSATLDDNIRACRAAFRFQQVAFARKVLSNLQNRPEANALPAVLSLQAQAAASEGSWGTACTLARKAAQHPGDNASEQFVLAAILLNAATQLPEKNSADAQAEAIELLVSLIGTSGETSIEAISLLIGLARQPTATQLFVGRDAAAWVAAAQKNPRLTPEMRVAMWDLRLAAAPDDKANIFNAFVTEWQQAPLPARLKAARWLNQRGRPELSLLISTPQKDESPDWFFVYLDSLAATNQWDSVLENLQAPSGQAASMPGALRAVFKLRAQSELRQDPDRAGAWKDIQTLLQSESVHNQLYVAQYAEKTGELRQAAVIYRRLLDGSSRAAALDRPLTREEKLRAYGALIRSIDSTASATEVLPLFEQLRADFPELEEAKNDAIYLRLLLGKQDGKTRDEIQQLVDRRPAVLAYRTNLALAELRDGNTAAAAKTYQGWQIDWSTAPDRFKAVRVAVLEASGDKTGAQQLRETIDLKKLRPEESALLK